MARIDCKHPIKALKTQIRHGRMAESTASTSPHSPLSSTLGAAGEVAKGRRPCSIQDTKWRTLMSTLTKKLLTGTALAACLIFTAPATSAQRGGNNESAQEAEARRRAATEQERATAEARRHEIDAATRREREARERKEREAAAGRKTQDDQAATDRKSRETDRRMDPAEREKILNKIRGEEERHREKIARIRRLRELSQGKQHAKRRSDLDRLEAKENMRYESQIARRRKLLGEKMHRQVEDRLKSGRGHDKEGKARHAARGRNGTHKTDRTIEELRGRNGKKGDSNDSGDKAGRGRGHQDNKEDDHDDGGEGRNPRSL
jgi:hypothetical protein